MKIGLNQWMFPAETSAVECFRLAKEAGAHGVEVNISFDKGELNLKQPLALYEELAAAVHEMNMTVPSVLPAGSWGNIAHMTPGSTDVDEVCRRLDTMCDIALTLKTDTILLVPGSISDGIPRYDRAWENTTAAIRKMVRIAESKRIVLAVENVWNKFLLSPLEMKQFIDQFESEYVKAYFDVGNILLYGFPEHWIEILSSRIKKVHVKDFRRSVASGGGFVGLLEGDVNWPKVRQSLDKIGYNDFITAELGRPAYHWETFIKTTCEIMHAILA